MIRVMKAVTQKSHLLSSWGHHSRLGLANEG
jgi:hypothetical protein